MANLRKPPNIQYNGENRWDFNFPQEYSMQEKRDDVGSNLKRILDYLIKIRKEVQEAQESLHKPDGPYGADALSEADDMSAEETAAILDNLGDVLDEITPQVENAKEMIEEIEEGIGAKALETIAEEEMKTVSKGCAFSDETKDLLEKISKIDKDRKYNDICDDLKIDKWKTKPLYDVDRFNEWKSK